MKNKLNYLILLASVCLGTANAATFIWTGAGVDSNDLDAADNWTAAGVPAAGNKLGTGPSTVGTSTDLISFDSETATALPTSNVDIVRIASNGTQLPNFELLNGSLNFNRAENWSFANTTFTIGDGDLTNSAVANFNATINLNRFGGLTTYVINTDGTLNIATNFTWDSGADTVVQLNGGTVDASGTVTGLTNRAGSFVSFDALDSSFTATFGGVFADLTAVTDQFGDSFTAANNWTLAATDNGDNSFTVTAVPEPSSFALLAGCFGLTWIMLRRRA